jgi:plastocyanin
MTLFGQLRWAAAAGVFLIGGNAAALTLQVDAVDKTGAPLADAVVYATPVNTKVQLKAQPLVNIVQINKSFVPKMTIVQTGTDISFPNKDSIGHDVYSFSPAKTFELKLYSGVPAKPILFDKSGLVTIGCNIHDQMIAYVMVVDTPYFAKTDAKGVVRLEGLVPGDYDVKAWHYRLADGAPPVMSRISVQSDQNVRVPLDVVGN